MSACSPDFNIMQANQPSIMQQQISRNFSARMLRKSNIYKIITENHHKGCSTEKKRQKDTQWATHILYGEQGLCLQIKEGK